MVFGKEGFSALYADVSALLAVPPLVGGEALLGQGLVWAHITVVICAVVMHGPMLPKIVHGGEGFTALGADKLQQH